jgi:PPK2 family polyphosphate:nucleotide phosphotransferase
MGSLCQCGDRCWILIISFARQQVVKRRRIITMRMKNIARKTGKISSPYGISKGKNFQLKNFDPADTGDLSSDDKPRIKEQLAEGIQILAELQERLYAQDKWAVLLIFQAMDAAGKDSTIKHVMSGINPQGCQVFSFKTPTSEELDHDFMWRCMKCLPERGRIGIFNRSYYEEVLVVRVHTEFLQAQKLPAGLVTKDIWKNRYEDIRDFERYLARNGMIILKFFLQVSKKEQKKRFLERLDNPQKNWKFSSADVEERQYWDDYMRAYEDMIRHTATQYAPWYVVPADHKWFTRYAVAEIIIQRMTELKLKFPQLSKEKRRELESIKSKLIGNAK